MWGCMFACPWFSEIQTILPRNCVDRGIFVRGQISPLFATFWHSLLRRGEIIFFFLNIWTTPRSVLELLLALKLRNHFQQCSENHVGCWQSNPGWPHAIQTLSLLYYLIGSRINFYTLSWTIHAQLLPMWGRWAASGSVKGKTLLVGSSDCVKMGVIGCSRELIWGRFWKMLKFWASCQNQAGLSVRALGGG